MLGTYSYEDNKLRVYSRKPIDRASRAALDEAEFSWHPREHVFAASEWTPEREDIVLALCGKIDDEDPPRSERTLDDQEACARRTERIEVLQAELFGSEQCKQAANRRLWFWNRKNYTLAEAIAFANENYFVIDFSARPFVALERRGFGSLAECLRDRLLGLQEAAELVIPVYKAQIATNERWMRHYQTRIRYDRDILAGFKAETLEAGGAALCWITDNWLEIAKVDRETVTLYENFGGEERVYTRTVPVHEVLKFVSKDKWQRLRAKSRR